MARRYLSLRDLTMFIMSFYFLIWGTLQCLVSLGVKGNAVMAAAQAYESGSRRRHFFLRERQPCLRRLPSAPPACART